MNPEQLQDAIGMVGEDLIQEAKIITHKSMTHKKKNCEYLQLSFLSESWLRHSYPLDCYYQKQRTGQ